MAVTIREVLSDENTGAAASVTTGAGTQSTDVLVVIGMSEYYSLGTFGPPTGGGWGTEIVTAARPGDDSKLRMWAKQAPGGATAISLSPILDEGVGLCVLVLEGVNLSDFVDAFAGAVYAGSGTSHPAPSCSPSSTNAFLVCAVVTEVFGGGGTFTAPAGMTERNEYETTGGGVTRTTVATQQLAASGATGAKSFTYTNSGVPGAGISVAFNTASSGLSITPAAVTVTAAAGTLSMAIGVTPAATTVNVAPGTMALGLNVSPGATTASVTPGTMAVGLNIAPAGPTVAVTSGTLEVVPDQPISPDAVTVTASAGTLSMGLNIAPDAVMVTASPGTVVITSGLAIIPEITTVSVTPGAVTITTQSLIEPSAVTVTASAGTLSIGMGIVPAGPTVSVTPGTASLGLNVSLTDPGVSIAPSPVTVTQEAAVSLVGPTVSVTPSTVTVATATITRRDTMVLPIAEDLLACLCEAVAEGPNPPASCCLRPGVTVAQGLSEHEDECCEGLAWVRVVDIFPSGGEAGFPNVNDDTSACSPPSFGIELEMGIYRCAPTGDHKDLPTCDDWTGTTEQILDDAASMRRAWCCFRDGYSNNAKIVGRWRPVTVQGGCTGGTMRVMIETYCLDCESGS